MDGLEGIVTEAGTPLTGITVALLNHATAVPFVMQKQTTNGSGHFQFSGLDTGQTYSVVAYDASGGTSYNALIYDKVVPVSITPTDTYWDKVVLLCGNDNAANGTTTFWDQSLRNQKILGFADAKYSSTTAPTGLSTSMKFDGTGDKLLLLASNDFNFSVANDFTLEFYFYHEVSADQAPWDARYVGLTDNNPVATIGTSGIRANWNQGNAISGSNPGQNAWYHYALSATAGTATLFSSGTSVGTAITNSIPDNICPMNIGSTAVFSTYPTYAYFQGYIAAFRVTRGVGRYTSNFTPPTLPLPTN